MLQLHSVFDCKQGPIYFSCGSITVEEQARLPRPFKSLFSLLDPLFDSTTLRLLLNTRLYKAIGACTILYDTDLQLRGRAVTSMFRDVTIEIYARFLFLSLLSMV